MTQEEKQLLTKDLCARLPYKPHIYIKDGKVVLNIDSVLNGTYINDWITVPSCQNITIKPYLRPISSLTAEECNKLFTILNINEKSGDWLKINDINVIRLFTENGKDFYEIAEAMDYLYSIHVDFRGLIEKGLALEAPEDMYKI